MLTHQVVQLLQELGHFGKVQRLITSWVHRRQRSWACILVRLIIILLIRQVIVLHKRLEEPAVNLKLFQTLTKSYDLINVLQLCNIVLHMPIVMIKILQILKRVLNLWLVLQFQLSRDLMLRQERSFNELMFGLDFFLDLFGNGVFDGW